jgi:hypothetical protein
VNSDDLSASNFPDKARSPPKTVAAPPKIETPSIVPVGDAIDIPSTSDANQSQLVIDLTHIYQKIGDSKNRRSSSMQVRWKTLIVQGIVWVAAEAVLTVAGLDNLADYSEFVFEKNIGTFIDRLETIV